MELDPVRIDRASRYKLMIGCIVPRPIAFVSTISPAGRTNLAPFSFFNGIGSDPMTLLFCPGMRPDADAEKDTLRNCKPRAEGGTGEFVVNAAIEHYKEKVAAAAEPLDYEASEFDAVGLTAMPSARVRPPRVAESPWVFECETLQVVRIDPARPDAGNVVIGTASRTSSSATTSSTNGCTSTPRSCVRSADSAATATARPATASRCREGSTHSASTESADKASGYRVPAGRGDRRVPGTPRQLGAVPVG